MRLRKETSLRRCLVGCLFVACGLAASAQDSLSVEQLSVVNTSVEERSVVSSNQQVITNFLKDNWFVLGDAGVNISDLSNKSKGSYAYTMIDIESHATEDIVKKLEESCQHA